MYKETMISFVHRTPTNGSDKNGNPLYDEKKTSVYAVIKGVKRNEFYNAMAAGMRPEITFEVYEAEYDGQKIIEYMDGEEIRRLNIIRTYPIKGERLEIICNDIAEAG